MKITVFGLGYVGIANTLLLAQKYEVTGVDISEDRVKSLQNRVSPLNDKEIIEFLATSSATWSTSTDSVKDAELVIVATPTDYDETTHFFNTSSVEAVIAQVCEMNQNAIILVKSTIPVGFVSRMREQHNTENIIFSPEFLREGRALYDNLYPSRIVVGEKGDIGQRIADLFLSCTKNTPPVVLTDSTEAEAVKLFANTYLAMRVAYFNELDNYAIAKNLNTADIIKGVSLDPRVGDFYNNPSFGYGGYCLPKDSKQLLANYEAIPNELIGAIVSSNQTRKEFIANDILKRAPHTVGIYKLSMKAGSDNFRASAIQDIITILQENNVSILLFEPGLNEAEFMGIPVVSNFDEFASKSDVIVANRREDELADFADKVYSRDLFFEN